MSLQLPRPARHSRISPMARIRVSRRGKAAAAVAVAQDVDFKHLWRQLRSVGWTAKKPSGLSNDWTYTKAGATGAEIGVDVFVGERAVIVHALESGLIADESEDGHESDGVTRAESDEVESDGVVRASQIDTGVQLSQRTVDLLFGSPSDVNEGDAGQEELSQAAVARAFDMSQSAFGGLEAFTDIGDEADAVDALRQMSDGGGGDSNDEDGEVPAPTPRRPRRTLVKDVNFLNEGEDSSEYENMSSEDSGSEIDVFADEDNVVSLKDREVLDDDDDELGDDDAPALDEAFLIALGGTVGDDVLSAAELKMRKETLRAMAWTPVSSEFEREVAPFPGLEEREAYPVPELRRVCHDPLQTRFYFMPKSLWVEITEETNRYRDQQIPARAMKIRDRRGAQPGRTTETLKQIRRRLRSKLAYGTHEVLHVMGLLVANMLCKRQGRFATQWSMTDDGAVPAGIFGRFMPRNRCTDILHDLHFVDNKAERPRDKLWKLRPVVDKVQERFLSGFTLPAVFSFDEGVLPATSKRNTTRMFMPDKPHRYGSKMFMTCDSRSAYCHRCVFFFERCYGSCNKWWTTRFKVMVYDQRSCVYMADSMAASCFVMDAVMTISLTKNWSAEFIAGFRERIHV